ncbi:MAG: glycosyltransferase family 39 protein [Lentisphaeria bacterium]|nr:glycosyltransferase family 39 protein [Lentisphaeria bacterium]
MKNFLENKHTLWVILLTAFILRLIPTISAAADENRLLRPDSAGYLEPAAALADSATFPTTRRPPGYPLFAAAVYFCKGGNSAIAFAQIFIAVAACAITALAAREYAGKAAGNLAALLMALNLTAIANTPLLLSDTLFSLFAAAEFYFFILFRNSLKFSRLAACTVIAAAAVLIRPINQLFILVLITMIFITPKLNWKKKSLYSFACAGIFLLIITPWMARNYFSGATFDIDTNTGAMRHQNGAMLLAKVNGTDFESEKAKLIQIENAAFADKEKFPDERSKELWRKAQFRQMVFAHPVTYFSQHFDLMILLPDAPSFLESFGVTSSDRGTMGVLKKDGIFAAIRHYFGENFILILSLLIPLLIPVMLLYCGVAWKLFDDLTHFKSGFAEIMLFLAFAEYYLFLPGSITAPRYQLPALPVLCTLAASAFLTLRKNPNADSAQAAAEKES